MFSGSTQYNYTCIFPIHDLQFYQCDDWTIMLLKRRNHYPRDQWTNYLEAAFGFSQVHWVWVWLCVRSSRARLLTDFCFMRGGDSSLDPLTRKIPQKKKEICSFVQKVISHKCIHLYFLYILYPQKRDFVRGVKVNIYVCPEVVLLISTNDKQSWGHNHKLWLFLHKIIEFKNDVEQQLQGIKPR